MSSGSDELTLALDYLAFLRATAETGDPAAAVTLRDLVLIKPERCYHGRIEGYTNLPKGHSVTSRCKCERVDCSVGVVPQLDKHIRHVIGSWANPHTDVLPTIRVRYFDDADWRARGGKGSREVERFKSDHPSYLRVTVGLDDEHIVFYPSHDPDDTDPVVHEPGVTLMDALLGAPVLSARAKRFTFPRRKQPARDDERTHATDPDEWLYRDELTMRYPRFVSAKVASEILGEEVSPYDTGLSFIDGCGIRVTDLANRIHEQLTGEPVPITLIPYRKRYERSWQVSGIDPETMLVLRQRLRPLRDEYYRQLAEYRARMATERQAEIDERKLAVAS